MNWHYCKYKINFLLIGYDELYVKNPPMDDHIRSTEAAFTHTPKIFKATAANSL